MKIEMIVRTAKLLAKVILASKFAKLGLELEKNAPKKQ